MAHRRTGNNNKMEEEVVPFSKSMGPVQGSLKLDESNNNNNNNKNEQTKPLSIEDRFRAERHAARAKHWRESSFAVGLVETTWSDEYQYRHEKPSEDFMCCLGWICNLVGADRVGNMAVLRQTTEWVEKVEEDDDEEEGQEKTTRVSRPRLLCLMGPYWPMVLLVTYPLILGVSYWTMRSSLPGKPLILQLVWAVCTLGLIAALAMTSFRDPGIMYRVQNPPPQEESLWRWNEQALTFRPRGAFYDPDCGVVVEEFDHT